jgi:hypothetical protein
MVEIKARGIVTLNYFNHGHIFKGKSGANPSLSLSSQLFQQSSVTILRVVFFIIVLTAECHDGECHWAQCCGAPKASFQIKILFVNDFQIPDHLRSDDDTTVYTLVSVLYAFSSSLTLRQNKLERFSLKSFFRLVWKDWANAHWPEVSSIDLCANINCYVIT